MKIAAITMVYNEEIYLPIWLRYYGSSLGYENLYIIDHGSDDRSRELIPGGANVIRIPRAESFDESPRTHFVINLQRALLQYYDAVIYGDCDEIIIPDPDIYSNFTDLLEESPELIAPIGLHVFQATDREAAIDLRLPILGQRKYCQYQTAMCKPVITKSKIDWGLGFHVANKEAFYAKDVYLFHLKSIDIEQSLERLQRTRLMKWSQPNIEGKIGAHHRMEDGAHVEAFFDAPLRLLRSSGDLKFNFSDDVDRIRASVTVNEGFYNPLPFHGKVAEIPTRFFGLV